MEDNNNNGLNPDWVKDEIHRYCINNNINEAEFYSQCNKIYAITYGWNLEFKKAEYCKDNNIGFLGLVDYCAIKSWVDNFYTVFMGIVKEKEGGVYHEMYTS